ncbi:MAG TPA: flagellar hook capping FlgD N-terminal domain-containing protein [Pyrinomonadaceae bacterium]|jgi:flagellar basal-body rod modification protein FlgD|nr:flagellar hook capping FlgD N-terminal domain-containing protein [Pyrinomonadaceae bacterium]
MNINSILGENTASSRSTSSTTNSSSERDMFMTLLVAQLKNQDPLAPQDGAQFVAQLAQFNSLDQLVGIRQSMDQLVAAMQQGQESNTSDQTK